MTSLGVTGGIGSGKTTVCRMLEGLGAQVFYADVEAKRIMQADPDVRVELVAAFGEGSYDANGRLDRAYLARRVFADEANVARINAIVHPRVFKAFEEAQEAARRDGVDVLVKEAALIFETGGDAHLDAVAVVAAPQAERVRRVAARDGVTSDQVLARMGHQLPPDDLRRRADYVVENTGSLDDLRRQVERLWREVREG